ncbi:quinone-dependent dihydroorotate dehydrogenase [Paracrocinitomix mangrovi]|uniref:quinone-dependent dihydroorotate dehydrogenase n=1 Tax=Paracrocinitomix mangrovi TaxID=2862509 RepID=UPI001C8DAE4F|nr:quinone-dependent dihydroorotate dehydrogenase [Paracrocinitomix mangrovi]UKN02945.1 quinone-dependent dihydroorotate dehydrogenase [Paracrocinitomix mangrovi]
MYKLFLRPILFLFDPEAVHHFTFKSIKLSRKIPGVGAWRRLIYSVNDKSLEKELFGIKFKNPVGIAAGFDKNALLLDELEDFGFGFVEIGTVTPKPQNGNPKPRLFRLKKDQAIINRMGFNNDGAEVIAGRLKNKKTKLTIGGNIGKNTATDNSQAKADYIFNFKQLHEYVDYFVVNVSCPNIGDVKKLQDQDFLEDLLTELKQLNATYSNPKPILLKIAPDLNDGQLDEVIEVIEKSGIDGVIATNTTITRDNLQTSADKLQQIGKGGLSGKPLTDRSTYVIRYLAEKSNKAFPIIGVGGIHSAHDAMEKLDAGADLVQVYTGFIYEGPKLVKKINKAIINRNR